MIECSSVLREALHADSVSRLNAHRKIEQLEQQGDEIIHVILKESANNFLTPFDREDIQELAHTLDDVIDYLYAISKRIELYKVHHFSPHILAMMEHVVIGCQALDTVIQDLHLLRFTPRVTSSILAVKKSEHDVDLLFDEAIAALFSEKGNAVEILKQKEILSLLSATTDRAEQTGSVIEGILLKFS